MVVKLAFGFYCFLIGLDICNRISKEQFLRMLRIVSWVTLLAILVKGAWYFPELRAPPTREGWKPEIPLFFAGGVNIEASMMVLASAFFVGRRSYYAFLFGALIVSVMYFQSRGHGGLHGKYSIGAVQPATAFHFSNLCCALGTGRGPDVGLLGRKQLLPRSDEKHRLRFILVNPPVYAIRCL